MDKIDFTDEYKTGIQTIDYEHNKLITYLNYIIEAKDMPDPRLIIEINLDELISYTVFHFKTEEELMKKHHYPKFEEHKKIHEALKEQALKFKQRFDDGEDITDELITFLKDWLLKHIKGVDMEYKDLFKQVGVP